MSLRKSRWSQCVTIHPFQRFSHQSDEYRIERRRFSPGAGASLDPQHRTGSGTSRQPFFCFLFLLLFYRCYFLFFTLYFSKSCFHQHVRRLFPIIYPDIWSRSRTSSPGGACMVHSGRGWGVSVPQHFWSSDGGKTDQFVIWFLLVKVWKILWEMWPRKMSEVHH